MIRLELTGSEAEWLQAGLATLVAAEESKDVVVVVSYQTLLDKVTLACMQAHVEALCPVCQRRFMQGKAGRTGRYCSNACKQKAYRQRRRAWRRQTPSRRP